MTNASIALTERDRALIGQSFRALAQAVNDLADDPDIAPMLRLAVLSQAKVKSYNFSGQEWSSGEGAALFAKLHGIGRERKAYVWLRRELTARLRERAPVLVHAFEPWLEEWLVALLRWRVSDAWSAAFFRFFRLPPNNPIMLLADGAFFGPPGSTLDDLEQLTAYWRLATILAPLSESLKTEVMRGFLGDGFPTPSPEVSPRQRRHKNKAVPDFPLRYREAYEVVRKRLEPEGKRPTQPEVAAELSISRSTLQNYLDDFELEWPPSGLS